MGKVLVQGVQACWLLSQWAKPSFDAIKKKRTPIAVEYVFDWGTLGRSFCTDSCLRTKSIVNWTAALWHLYK